MKVLFVKGDNVLNVRLSKFLRYFQNKGIPTCFWGWDRSKTKASSNYTDDIHYLLTGGGFGGTRLAFFYFLWILKVLWHALFYKSIKEYKVIAVNFDSALPIYLASRIRGFSYIYEIRDEFALSYNFSPLVKKIIRQIDHVLMRKSQFVIHVDANRVTYRKCDYIIIENSPEDFFNGKSRSYDNLQLQYAITGNMTETRGIDQICKFARKNKNVSLLVVGRIPTDEVKHLLFSLKNIEYHDFMPQTELFSLMDKCCGVFSLFDPCLEINRLAASNKVYDAMMMGIPVITNREVQNSDFIINMGCGLVINYMFDDSWNCLADSSFLEIAKEMGRQGRDLYLREYQFSTMVDNRLLPKLLS